MASFRKRSNGWSFRYEVPTINGNRKQIERGGFRTKKEAEKAYRELVDEYDKTGRIFTGMNVTYADYLDFWLENYCEMNLKNSTTRSYESMIRSQINPSLGHLPIMSLGPGELQAFMNDLKKTGLSKSSINLIRAILSKSLKMAVYPYQYIKENPMQYVETPKFDEVKKMKTITAEEYKQILSLYPREDAIHMALIIGYRTGMRIGEIRGLMWKDVDFDAAEIRVERQLLETKGQTYRMGTPKTKTSLRAISCDSGLLSILREHRMWQKENKLAYGPDYFDSDFVVTEKWGFPLTIARSNSIGHHVQEELGISFSFHHLRHTHASRCIEAGMDMKSLQHRLGHSTITTTMDVYGHILEGLKNKNRSILESIADV